MPQLLQTVVDGRLASRIWQRETTVFAPADAPAALHDAIRNRLGWLDAPARPAEGLADLDAFTQQVRRDGLNQVCLLGMGGSSLCAEVLRELRSAAPAGSLVVLDSTDERTIDQVAASLTPARTLFLVASKSGGTIEVSSLERYFWERMSGALGGDVGRHFAAITDPGTSLVAHAAARGYRHTFLNPPDIGGRYSALSLFGLVPASLLGVDVRALLTEGRRMADACRPDSTANPGLALGAFMAEHAASGRDKLTLLLPVQIGALGLWIEQLIAESTGKQGRGVLPIVDEPQGIAADYGSDRAFVALLPPHARAVAARADAVEAAGHPVFRIEVASLELGTEFFRWEFATAVAGAALGINPFDEPNVKDAKARTQSLLDAFHASGALRIQPPFERRSGCLVREHKPAGPAAASPGGLFVALLDYLPTDRSRIATVERVRTRLRHLTKAATTYGVGPRYLHSTGQYHKGGPNNGLFLYLTADDGADVAIPGEAFSFSSLKRAQALGDLESLRRKHRRVLHLDLGKDVEGGIGKIAAQV